MREIPRGKKYIDPKGRDIRLIWFMPASVCRGGSTGSFHGKPMKNA
jgi:hypothetical protein